jgi:hypothetical protein
LNPALRAAYLGDVEYVHGQDNGGDDKYGGMDVDP